MKKSASQLLHQPMTRRQILIAASTLIVPPAMFTTWGISIEPQFPVLETVKLKMADYPGPLNLVHIADLHFWEVNELMVRAAKMINDIYPDFIFLTGDLVEDPSRLPACLDWLVNLEVKARIIFSPGNWEHWTKTLENNLREHLEDIGVEMLCNEGAIYESIYGPIYLVGIDDVYFGKPDIDAAFAEQPRGMATIVISHAPAVVNRIEKFRADLTLSGHTHGGQVRLPLIGALHLPPGSAGYESGLYELERTTLYVTRGLGTSTIPVRFLCPPEVTHIVINEK